MRTLGKYTTENIDVLKRMSHAENMSESNIVVQKLEREHDFQRQAS